MGSRSRGSGGRPLDETIEQRVHDAIVELAERRALDSATLDVIAGLAGVAKSTLYRRYGSKDQLLRWAMFRFADTAIAIPGDGHIRERLVSLVTQQVERYVASSGLELVRLAFQGLAPDGDGREEARGLADGIRSEYVGVFTRAVESGELRPDVDPELCVDIVFGAMWGRVFGLLVVDDARGFAEAVVDHVLRGLAAPA